METHKEDSCIFCKIVAKEIPAHHILYEDAEVMAFLDIAPNSHGHTLVIPKDHFENIYTIPEERWCHVMLIAKKIAPAVREAVQADGVNLVMNNEAAAGQVVPHVHIHVIPRHTTDTFPHWPHKAYIGDEAKAVADKIKESLEK
jgi:histidine triad (HIT) family protein